jgi:hypothetical protein
MVKCWEVEIGSGQSAAFVFGLNFVLFGGQNYEEIFDMGKNVFFLEGGHEFKFGMGCIKSSFGLNTLLWYPKPTLEVNLHYV